MKRAFTLLEVLAAVTVLGLLATALVPLVLQQGRGQGRMADELAARAALAQALASWRPSVGERRTLADHPAWWIEAQPLVGAEVEGAGPRPAHSWLLVAVRDGDASRPLAERLVLAGGAP